MDVSFRSQGTHKHTHTHNNNQSIRDEKDCLIYTYAIQSEAGKDVRVLKNSSDLNIGYLMVSVIS